MYSYHNHPKKLKTRHCYQTVPKAKFHNKSKDILDFTEQDEMTKTVATKEDFFFRFSLSLCVLMIRSVDGAKIERTEEKGIFRPSYRRTKLINYLFIIDNTPRGSFYALRLE